MISFDKKLLWLNIREIHLKNSAHIETVSDSELISLTESIFENGILKPLIVRKVSLRGYELISGFRRLLAAKRLNLRRVPCIVCTADDKAAALIRLNDNLCRFVPSFLEEAREIDAIIRTYNIPQEELAVKLGLSRSEILKKLSILKLDDETLTRINEAKLGEDFAVLLLNTPPKLRNNALDIIIAEAMSLKQAQNLISSMLVSATAITQNIGTEPLWEETPIPTPCEKEKEAPPPIKAQIGDIRLFSNSLSRLVETMKSAGLKVKSTTLETKKYTEYKVRIEKEAPPKETAQLELSLR